jgi:hypothetical protein
MMMPVSSLNPFYASLQPLFHQDNHQSAGFFYAEFVILCPMTKIRQKRRASSVQV